ncbi:MAG TPA: polyprenyl synthetase family protein [Candidatus Thermoplasmatota archaeon]|nr:polyprenyl synthetase family protein [Candidatus Thermoplasmatota archaeon]
MPPTLYQAAWHLPNAGGKRIRPFLALTSCESVAGTVKSALPFASALELMHNFTLVHDDIMDRSLLRRNYPTVHVKFGEPSAILAGDLVFAKSFEALLDTPVEYQTFKTLEQWFIDCIIAICEGQHLDMEFEKRATVSEKEYLGMIKKKTAVLFQLSAKGGALIGGGNPKEIAALSTYGLSLGLAFQIWDDCLDMSSDEKTIGKDIGNDIRNGKKTMIAVHSLSHATGKQKDLLKALFGNRQASDAEVKKVFRCFRDLGSIEYAQNQARRLNARAKKALASLPDSKASQLLRDLADYAIQREK